MVKEMGKNILILFVMLLAVAAVIYGITYMGSKVDNKTKYQHPITRPGASW